MRMPLPVKAAERCDLTAWEVIGEPSRTPSKVPEKTLGYWQKVAARDAIDRGEIVSEQDLEVRFKVRVKWILSQLAISETTRMEWVEIERMFTRSAMKYFREIELMKKGM